MAAKFHVGDIVALKTGNPNKPAPTFVWGQLTIDDSEWLVVNIPYRYETTFHRLSPEQRSDLKLFQAYDYILVKSYDLLKAEEEYPKEDKAWFKELIRRRMEAKDRVGLCLHELTFRYSLTNALNFSLLLGKLRDTVFEGIVDHPKYLFKNQSESTNAKLLQIKLLIFQSVTAELACFGIVKNHLDAIEIAKNIVVKPGYSLFEKLLDDRNLLKQYSILFKGRDAYTSAKYYSSETSSKNAYRQILSPAFFDDIESKSQKYEDLLKSQREIEDSINHQFQEINPDFDYILGNGDLNSLLFEDDITKLQKALFLNLGTHIPIGDEIGDNEYYNDKLLAYLPVFKWLRPHDFAESVPGLRPPDLRKLHLRHIKNFIVGKF